MVGMGQMSMLSACLPLRQFHVLFVIESYTYSDEHITVFKLYFKTVSFDFLLCTKETNCVLCIR